MILSVDTSIFDTNLNSAIEEKFVHFKTGYSSRDNKKNIWGNTLPSLSQVRGTIYTSTE